MDDIIFTYLKQMKSQFQSTDINSDGSSISSEITLRIDTADPKCMNLFLNAEGSDFKIYHKTTFYSVHRWIIFKHINLHVLDDQTSEGCLHAPDKLKTEILIGILSCLYGDEFQICRKQVLLALDVIHFLKIAKLKKIIEEDIISNFEEYELFPVLQKAKLIGMNEVEQLCLNHLQLEGYQQMRYGKYELLSCSQQIFKFVLHRHNERRWEDPAFGQTDKNIQELIQQYCKHKNYNQRQKNHLLKSFNELSVKSEMPININHLKITPLKLKQSTNDISIRVYTPRTMNTESMLSPASHFKSNHDNQGTRSMIMDLSFMSGHRRRKSSNRGSENNSSQSNLCSEVITLKETVRIQDQQIESLNSSVEKMIQTMDQKETQLENNKFRLSQIEALLQSCEKDTMQNNRNFRLLEVKFNKVAQRLEDSSLYQSQQEKYQSDSQSDDEQDSQKPENPKDAKLRVSLIQSKWVCC